jgi:hypothetical protein
MPNPESDDAFRPVREALALGITLTAKERQGISMKQPAGLLLLLAASVGSLLPQTRPNPTKVSIELGSVTVWLGMSKTQMVLVATGAGYRTMDHDNNIIVLDAKGIVGTCSFASDRLVFASRSWWRPGGDTLTATIDALAALASYGHDCELTHAPINKPTLDVNRLFVTCGDRSVLVVKGRANSPSDSEVIEVDERIGTLSSQQ